MQAWEFELYLDLNFIVRVDAYCHELMESLLDCRKRVFLELLAVDPP